MSHSRKNVNAPKEVKLLQDDLKSNYSKGQLLVLARHYGISPVLNKERLTMEIARANFRNSARKARLPSGIELTTFTQSASNANLNRQTLVSASRDCTDRLNELDALISGKLSKLRTQRDQLFKAMEEGLKLAPEAFSQILPQVLGDCAEELTAIHDCIVAATDKADQSAANKLQQIQNFVQQIEEGEEEVKFPSEMFPSGSAAESIFKTPQIVPIDPNKSLFSPASPLPVMETPTPSEINVLGMASAPALGGYVPQQAPRFASAPSVIAGIPGMVSPTPSESEESASESEEETPAESEIDETIYTFGSPPSQAPPSVPESQESVFTFGSPPSQAPPSVPGEVVETPVVEFTQEPLAIIDCESDEDCEQMQREGMLSGRLPGQKVICVSKRNGSPDCAYQA